MTLLWSEGQPIVVEVNRRGRPVQFTWQERRHPLKYVVLRWQVDVDWWTEHRRIWRRYLVLITTSHLLCLVYQDLASQEWRLVRVYD